VLVFAPSLYVRARYQASRLNLYKLSLILKDIEEGHLLIENVVNTFFMKSLPVSLHNLLDLYIYIYINGVSSNPVEGRTKI
jgi:hypothetical protein